MVKVFIAGASGLLGSTLSPYLKSVGHEVIRQGAHTKTDVTCDLTEWEATKSALDASLPDVIVNLVACTNVDACEREPQKAYRLNVLVVEHLAKWIQQSKKKCHLIQISTDMVYDGAGLKKENAINLCNYYAFSKYAGELAAATVSATILRTNFFGSSQCEGRVSLSDWIIKSLVSGESIKVFEDVYFSPLSLSSLVRILAHVIDVRQPGIYNLGSRAGMSKADFAFELAKARKLDTSPMTRDVSESVQFSAYRPKNMSMDSSFFEKTFNMVLPSLMTEITSLGVV